MKSVITALAGGVGAARFLTGLTKLVKEEDLSVIVNTGDDMEMFGLHISPDIDIVSYTLAGIVDDEKGWGIRGDTFHCLEALKKMGLETWFNIGDMDFATHIHRTELMRKGFTLSEVTREICRRLGVKVEILPMTDDKFETWIRVESGLIHFEEYFVKRQAQDEVLGVEFVGSADAEPAPKVIDAILNADLVTVCPSNPIVSIGSILSFKGVREALKKTNARIVGVSPIVNGSPIKGPADKLLRGLGFEVSAYSVAKLYRDFLDVFVIDTKDSEEKGQIEKLGVKVKVTDTVMRCLEDKVKLAKAVLEN